uniref:Cyclin-dependent kinase inhibitor domain-containing protein n=1 Tax=Anopheles maculatus TaxID=74869 RepID=A0A182SCH7_9DIPT
MHMKQQDEKKMKRWNFNFRIGEPLDGQFKWVRPHECSVFTLTQAAHVRTTVRRRQATTSDVPQSSSSSSSGDILSPDELMDERAELANRVVKMVQPKITVEAEREMHASIY